MGEFRSPEIGFKLWSWWTLLFLIGECLKTCLSATTAAFRCRIHCPLRKREILIIINHRMSWISNRCHRRTPAPVSLELTVNCMVFAHKIDMCFWKARTVSGRPASGDVLEVKWILGECLPPLPLFSPLIQSYWNDSSQIGLLRQISMWHRLRMSSQLNRSIFSEELIRLRLFVFGVD